MKFQRAHRSIIRSIRQVALARTWVELRGTHALPLIKEYEPSERSGDAHDLLLTRVMRDNGKLRLFCKRVGSRVDTAQGTSLQSQFVDECIEPKLLASVLPLWETCLETKLPVYAISPTADRDGCPVTLEKLYLPFSRDNATPEYMLISLHAFSTEGRFILNGLLRTDPSKAPLHWAVVIDPMVTVQNAPPTQPAAISDDYALV